MVVFVSSPSSLSACERPRARARPSWMCSGSLRARAKRHRNASAAFGLSGAGDAPLEQRQMRPDLGQKSGRRLLRPPGT
jgi:hypothetical protein